MVAAKIREIQIGQLHFDPRNPRLPKRVDGAKDDEVLDWMLNDAGLVELMTSIAENGFFPAEPLLVCRRDTGGGYWVLEGNRRLAAVKLLASPETAPRRKRAVQDVASLIDGGVATRLPCVVFEDRTDVLDYLGFRHVTGVKQWEPAAKARYLAALYEEHVQEAGDGVYRVLARIIGSKADYVARLLLSLRLHESLVKDEGLSRRGLTEESISFSLLTLALNYTEIQKYLKLSGLTELAESQSYDNARLKRLGQYMYLEDPELGRTQLGESRNMRLLAACLSHPAGRERLRAGDIVENAVEHTFDMQRVLAVSIKAVLDRLTRARDVIDKIEVTTETVESLVPIESLVEELMAKVREGKRSRTRRR